MQFVQRSCQNSVYNHRYFPKFPENSRRKIAANCPSDFQGACGEEHRESEPALPRSQPAGQRGEEEGGEPAPPEPRRSLSCHGIRQTLEGSFSAVSKPNFASKYAFESSRRDLHNALLCTAPKSHFFKKLLEFAKFCEIFQKFAEIAELNFCKILQKFDKFDKKLRLQSCAKECIV